MSGEVLQAALSIPVAFVPDGDAFQIVAVMGYRDEHNLFVAPDGRWLGSYVPARLRLYPFSLIPSEQDTLVFCVDEASGLLSERDDIEQAESFFSDGQLVPALKSVFDVLAAGEKFRASTKIAIADFQKHGLIQPWPASINLENDRYEIEGLFRINEQALNTLPAEVFVAMRDSGALAIAYAHLLSQQNLGTIRALAQAHLNAQAQMQTKSELSYLRDTISFD